MSTNSSHYDVAIVGSGFGGSTTACQLAEAGVLSPRLDSEMIIAHTLNLSRTDLWTQGKRVLSESEVKDVNKYMERRLNREPISQIVGHQEFWSLDFIVDKNGIIRDILIGAPRNTPEIYNRLVSVIEKNKK